MNNLLAEIWRSTAELYERFRLLPDRDNTRKVFIEEATELLTAQAQNTPYGAHGITTETADVIVTALGICMAAGLTLQDVTDAIQTVITKNDAKTHETHYVNEAGKITRRVKETGE